MQRSFQKTIPIAVLHMALLYGGFYLLFNPEKHSPELVDFLLPQATVISYAESPNRFSEQIDSSAWWEDFMLTKEGEQAASALKEWQNFKQAHSLDGATVFSAFLKGKRVQWCAAQKGALKIGAVQNTPSVFNNTAIYRLPSNTYFFRYQGICVLASSQGLAEQIIRHAKKQSSWPSRLTSFPTPETDNWIGLNQWQLLPNSKKAYPFAFFQPVFSEDGWELHSLFEGQEQTKELTQWQRIEPSPFFSEGAKNYLKGWTYEISGSIRATYREVIPWKINKITVKPITKEVLAQAKKKGIIQEQPTPTAFIKDSTLYIKNKEGKIVSQQHLPFTNNGERTFFAFPDANLAISQLFQLNRKGYLESWQNSPSPSLGKEWKKGWRDVPTLGRMLGVPLFITEQGRQFLGWVTENGALQVVGWNGKPKKGFPLRFNERVIARKLFVHSSPEIWLVTSNNNLVKVDMNGKVIFRKLLREGTPEKVTILLEGQPAKGWIVETFKGGRLNVFNHQGEEVVSRMFKPSAPTNYQLITAQKLPSFLILTDSFTQEGYFLNLVSKETHWQTVKPLRVLAVAEQGETLELYGKATKGGFVKVTLRP